MDDSSRALVDALKHGDKDALDALMRRHLPGLRAFVRLRSGPFVREHESMSDLVQSTCREVLVHADRFRYDGEAGFRWWLFTTALRKIRDRQDYLRAAKRDVARRVSPRPAGAESDFSRAYGTLSTPSGKAASREEIDRIEAAFATLPDEYREVILLSRIVGLSRAEIAKQLGKTEASVRSLLHRAGKKLGELLGSSETA